MDSITAECRPGTRYARQKSEPYVQLWVGSLQALWAWMICLQIGGHGSDPAQRRWRSRHVLHGLASYADPVGPWHVRLLLAFAVCLGTAHIFGDELTHGGYRILWAFSEHEFRFGASAHYSSPPLGSARTRSSSCCSPALSCSRSGTPRAIPCEALHEFG